MDLRLAGGHHAQREGRRRLGVRPRLPQARRRRLRVGPESPRLCAPPPMVPHADARRRGGDGGGGGAAADEPGADGGLGGRVGGAAGGGAAVTIDIENIPSDASTAALGAAMALPGGEADAPADSEKGVELWARLRQRWRVVRSATGASGVVEVLGDQPVLTQLRPPSTSALQRTTSDPQTGCGRYRRWTRRCSRPSAAPSGARARTRASSRCRGSEGTRSARGGSADRRRRRDARRGPARAGEAALAAQDAAAVGAAAALHRRRRAGDDGGDVRRAGSRRD